MIEPSAGGVPTAAAFHSRLAPGAGVPPRVRGRDIGPACDEVPGASTSAAVAGGTTFRVPGTKALAGVPPTSPEAGDVASCPAEVFVTAPAIGAAAVPATRATVRPA